MKRRLENVFGVSSGAPMEEKAPGATRREEEYKERLRKVPKKVQKKGPKKELVEKGPTRSAEGSKRFQKVPREGPKV